MIHIYFCYSMRYIYLIIVKISYKFNKKSKFVLYLKNTKNKVTMNILETPRAKRYFAQHPIVEIYKGYEIREAGNGMFLVDAAIGIYGTTSNYIGGCREFIDNLVSLDIKQYDDEAVAKYIFHNS